jgi:hypothetical protein
MELLDSGAAFKVCLRMSGEHCALRTTDSLTAGIRQVRTTGLTGALRSGTLSQSALSPDTICCVWCMWVFSNAC